jgi:hypothetical protein
MELQWIEEESIHESVCGLHELLGRPNLHKYSLVQEMRGSSRLFGTVFGSLIDPFLIQAARIG